MSFINKEEEELQKILQEDLFTVKVKLTKSRPEDVEKILAEKSDEEEYLKKVLEKEKEKEKTKNRPSTVEQEISDPLLLIDLQEREQILKSQKELITTLDDKRRYSQNKIPILGYEEVNCEKVEELKQQVGILTALTYFGNNIFIGTAFGVIVMYTLKRNYYEQSKFMKIRNKDFGMVTCMTVHPGGILLASGYSDGYIAI